MTIIFGINQILLSLFDNIISNISTYYLNMSIIQSTYSYFKVVYFSLNLSIRLLSIYSPNGGTHAYVYLSIKYNPKREIEVTWTLILSWTLIDSITSCLTCVITPRCLFHLQKWRGTRRRRRKLHGDMSRCHKKLARPYRRAKNIRYLLSLIFGLHVMMNCNSLNAE